MSHSHLTLEERIVIELFVRMGLSCRKIATYLGRSHTSVCRELRRNSFPKVATNQTAERRTQKRRTMPWLWPEATTGMPKTERPPPSNDGVGL